MSQEEEDKKRLKLVIGTNVVIANALWKDSIANKAVEVAFKDNTVQRSENSYYILEKMMMSSKFDKYLTRDSRKRFLELFREITKEVEITNKVKLSEDIYSNVILELAYNGESDFIISGEPDIMKHDKRHKSINVISPDGFLQKCNIQVL